MEIFMNVASVPAIVLITYWIIIFLKTAFTSEKFKTFIPIIACGVGVVLGAIIYFAFPDMIIAQNVIYAIIIGGSSGLAATGTNQVFKQLSFPKENSSNSKTIEVKKEKENETENETEN